MSLKEDLETKIALEELRLAELKVEIATTTARLTELRRQHTNEGFVQVLSPWQPVLPTADVPLTNTAKVVLFRSLFRGREDVFPRRWENVKKGRSGYAPACRNEWANSLCEKKRGLSTNRRATCGECPNQAFIPVSNEEIAKHLRGDQVMGVYPLMTDETCWFLAADFDDRTWQEDAAAFAETCELQNIEIALERSRSGNGAHAWIFFASPVSAVAARKLGCFLITETMTRRHQLSMKSYDRLFPSQDTMTKGGFGNLIALPLQRHARDASNSVFVDATFRPWTDQWAFLATVKRNDPNLVCAIAEEASCRGQVIGVRMINTSDEDSTPWTHFPSGRPRNITISQGLPAAVKAVLSQRLFIQKVGLPSALLNQLLRLAAFQNPEFYKKQRMRLSTALTPRVIACGENLREHIALPRGCLPEAEAMLREYGVTLCIEDQRERGKAVDFTFHGTLTLLQEQAAKEMLAYDMGVFVAPPGIGKTVVGTYLVATRKTSTLILVHRKLLLDQWVGQLALFLGIGSQNIGQIGAGNVKPNGYLDVAMVQSLVRRGSVSDVVAGYGQVIHDEAHHSPAVSFERVLAEVKAKYIVGLTATPQRRDGLHPILHMQLGPVRYAVDAKDKDARRPFAQKLIVRETGFVPIGLDEDADIQELYSALAADQRRNDLIFNDVVRALEEKRSPILLTERRDHLEYFADRLRNFTRNMVVLHGGMKPRERRNVITQLASIPGDEERLLIATGRYIGEGFNDARLDTLFLALPVSWKGTLIQYSGRLHRLHSGKTDVRIYDYVDSAVPMMTKMFEKRLRGYRAIGYNREEELLGHRKLKDEFVVEFDKEALCSFDGNS